MSIRYGRRDVLRTLAAGTAVGAIAGTAQTAAATPDDERWRFEYEDIVDTGATVVDGTVHVVANNVLLGIDAETGEREWFFDDWQVSLGSHPTVVDGTAYCGTVHSEVVAIETDTDEDEIEEVLWEFEEDQVSSMHEVTPTVADGTVFAAGEILSNVDGVLFALDAETGDEQWRFEAEAYGTSVTVVEDTVYFVTRDDVIALDVDDGDELWRTEFDDDSRIQSTATITDGTIYLGRNVDNGGTTNYLTALDAETGDEEWSYEADASVTGAPTIADGLVYAACAGDGDEHLSALDVDDGAEQWRYDDDIYAPAPPTVADGVVYFGDFDGWLYGLDTEDGSVLWEEEISANSVTTPPIAVDGVLYVGCDMEEEDHDERGDIVAFSLDGDGSSVDSRTMQGVLNHHDGFEGDGSPIVDPGSSGGAVEAVSDSTPGFGIATAFAALGGASYLLGSWFNEDADQQH